MALGRMAIIGLGSLAMFVSMLLQRKEYPQVAVWKMFILVLWLTVTGVAGTMILAYIETGNFGGTSFYGAIFMVPVLIAPAMLMKIGYRDILNLCAPAEAAMLFVMRFDCLDKGCCVGRYIPQLEFQFPNQIAEMVVALSVMAILMRILKKDRTAWLYPRYMILYGICRFLLQGFRYGGTNPWALGLSAGHLWSLVSITIGTVWLLAIRSGKKTGKEAGKKTGKKA